MYSVTASIVKRSITEKIINKRENLKSIFCLLLIMYIEDYLDPRFMKLHVL